MKNYKITIQQRVFEQLVDKKSFTRAELDKAIWIAQGFDAKLFTRRSGYYGTNLSNWISTKLVKRIKRGVFKITSRGKLYLTDRGRCNKIIWSEKTKRQRANFENRKTYQELYEQSINRHVDPFKNLIGTTIKSVRRLSPTELDNLGWSKNPLVLVLNNGTCLIPQLDDEGNDGGAVLHYNYRDEKETKIIYTT